MSTINNEIIRYHGFVTDKILQSINKPMRNYIPKRVSMQELVFEDKSIDDKQGNEWGISGSYHCDLDREGDWDDEKLTGLYLWTEKEIMGETRILGFMPNDESKLLSYFEESTIDKLKEKLRDELFKDLNSGRPYED